MQLSAYFGSLNRSFRHFLTIGLLFQAILMLVAKHHSYSFVLKVATVMAYPTIQYPGEKRLQASSTMNDQRTSGIPMPCSGSKTCDALRVNDYFGGTQFGTACPGVI